MEQRDYSKDLPLEPPEGLISWLKEKGKFRTHVLRYRAARVQEPLSGEWEKVAELKCSGCGGTMYASRIDAEGCHNNYSPAPFGYLDPETGKDVISGNTVKCPMCGETVKVYHSRSFQKGATIEERWPMVITRLEDKLVLMGWCISHFVSKDLTEEIITHPYEAYVVEEKKVIRLMGYIKCISTISFYGHWEQRKTCLDNWGDAELVYPWDPAILQGSTAENSKLDLYMRQAKTRYPVTYLRLWQRHRNVENLVMQGCGYLLGEMIRTECYTCSYERAKGIPKLEDIHWKETRPSKMLGLDGETFRFCRDMRWDPPTLHFFINCRFKGVKLQLPKDLADCVNTGTWWCGRLLDEGLPMMRCVRYLKKQQTRDKRADRNILDDYWRIARQQGYDLKDEHVRFPKDLMREHDRLVREQRMREEAELKKKRDELNLHLQKAFRERLNELERFGWHSGGLFIRPCAAPEELDREGKALNHCVATYKQKHAKGPEAIFFIRKEKEPDKPWFTLELNVKGLTVVQNRGKCNCARTAQVEKFEQDWLEHIRTIKQPKKKKEDKIA